MSDPTTDRDDEPAMTFTVAQSRELLRALQSVPIVGLHNQHVGAVDDPERVIDHVRAFGPALSQALADNERMWVEAAATASDLRAVGRLFARISQAQQ